MVWHNHPPHEKIQKVSGMVHRIVESQESAATINLVDTLDEQALLEEMLDKNKPAYMEGTEDLNYLLKTPFRYAPLPWGSRFGTIMESGIFYGGKNTDVTLSEAAFYRFVLFDSIDSEYKKECLIVEHTLFKVPYATDRGVLLHRSPFDQYELNHPASYEITKSLGVAMRGDGVEAFEYTSARCKKQGHCVGIFTPQAFMQKKPVEQKKYISRTTAKSVEFKAERENTVWHFDVEDFFHNMCIPSLS